MRAGGMVPSQNSATRRGSTLVLSCALLALSNATSFADIFETDDRRALPPERKGLEQQIGVLVNTRNNLACTAFCVSERVVGTAAHCLYGTDPDRSVPLSDFRFRLGMQNTKSQTQIAAVSKRPDAQSVLAGDTLLSLKPPIAATSDWAFVRLQQPACLKNLKVSTKSSLEVREAARQERMYVVGFHKDFGDWELALSGPCRVDRDYDGAPWASISREFSEPENLLLHRCATGGASSGSPLLIDGEDGPEVVGISLGTYVQSQVVIENGAVVHRYRSQAIANTAVSAMAFAEPLETFLVSDLSIARPKVRDLQRVLTELGYYTAGIDGIISTPLKAAIREYERAEGLPCTGLATTALLDRLRSTSKTSEASLARGKKPPVVVTGATR